MKKTIVTSVLAAFCFSTLALSHGVWISMRADQLTVIYGHGAEDNAYVAQKVKTVVGFTEKGEKRTVEMIPTSKNMTISVPSDVVMTSMYFDNGFWIKGTDGKWQNVGKVQVPNGTESHHPIKYNTHIFKNMVNTPKPTGEVLEIFPLVNPVKLKVGDDLPVQVLFRGKPYANIQLINDYINRQSVVTVNKTDAAGKIVLKVTSEGLNVIGMEFTEKTPKDANADEIFYFVTLSFVLPHVE